MKPGNSYFLFILFLLTNLDTNAQFKMEKILGINIKNSLNSINKANDFLVDNSGNCYILGTTWKTDSTKDILLVKVKPDGKEEWIRTYNNSMQGDDIPFAMCLDLEGNIWVCGMAKLKPNNGDLLVVKFNSDGIPVNENIYDGPSKLFDCGTAITTDSKGNVFVAGYETSVDSGINMVVFRCKSDASFSWKRTYATREMDVANSVLTDDSSNVYVCGTSNSGLHSADILLQKYNVNGDKKWERVYDGVLSQSDFGQFLAVDDSMNLYASGFINSSNSRSDIPVLKYSRGGTLIQESYYNGRIAACLALSLKPSKNSVFLIGGCNDYNISENSTFLNVFTKGGKESFLLKAPADVNFMNCYEVNGSNLILGSKITHPESTLLPYIGVLSGDSVGWSFADPTISGLSYIIATKVAGNAIYFLGDDTGEATGSISIFKYLFKIDTAYKKPIPKKKK